jgi:FkbM family methyltransferase
MHDYRAGLDTFLQGGEFLEFVLENMYKAFLKPGDLAIDGGANRGRHTLPMADCVGTGGEIIAFEAIPDLAADLRQKTADLPVSVFNKALALKPGRVSFFHCVERDWRSGIQARKFIQSLDTVQIEVEAVDLDSAVERTRRVAFMKFDLEGGEYDAIRGAESIIERCHPLIVAEHGGLEGASLYGYDNLEYYEFWKKSGYTIIDLLGRFVTAESFQKPDVWYFAALNLQDESHRNILEMFPAFLISASQSMLSKRGRLFSSEP